MSLDHHDEEITGLDLLLTREEAQEFLESRLLPADFASRAEEFVRYAVCPNCDDTLDMNIVVHDHTHTSSVWCEDCCMGEPVPAFERFTGRPLTPGDLRVAFDHDHAWRREDPLTLNEAVTFVRTGELPDDFAERVALVEEYGPVTVDEDLRGRVVTTR